MLFSIRRCQQWTYANRSLDRADIHTQSPQKLQEAIKTLDDSEGRMQDTGVNGQDTISYHKCAMLRHVLQ